MQKLFYLYLSVSLSASVIMAVLLLCRPLWKRRFSKSWQYYIWLLAVARLLIPFSPAPGMIGRAAERGSEYLAAGAYDITAQDKQIPVMEEEFTPSDEGLPDPKEWIPTDGIPSPNAPITFSHTGKDIAAGIASQAFSFLWIIWFVPALSDFLPSDTFLPQMPEAFAVGMYSGGRHGSRRNMPQCGTGTEDPAQNSGVLLQRDGLPHADRNVKTLHPASGERTHAGRALRYLPP